MAFLVLIVGNAAFHLRAALGDAEIAVTEAAHRSEVDISAALDGLGALVATLAAAPSIASQPTAEAHAATELLLAVLDAHPAIAAVSASYGPEVGYRISRAVGRSDAPASAAFVAQTASPEVNEIRFLDADGRVLQTIESSADSGTAASALPGRALWRDVAAAANGPIRTPTYRLPGIEEPGFAAAATSRWGNVVAVEMPIDQLSSFLRDDAFIFDAAGGRLAGGEAEPGGVQRSVADLFLVGEIPEDTVRLLWWGGWFSLARVSAVEITGGRPDYLAVVRRLPTPLDDRLFLATIGAGLLLAGITIAVAFLLIGRLVKSLRGLNSLAGSLGRLALDVARRPPPALAELAEYNDHLESMRYVLNAATRYLPRTLVQQFLEQTMEPELGGSWKEITVMITGVRNFTAITEGQNPGLLFLQLSEYFRTVGRSIREYQGVINKFNGDSLMVLYNAVADSENHGRKALLTALGIRYTMATINELWEANGQDRFESRIGIHTGAALVGNIGNEERLEFTAMGSAVNLATRLEAMNRHFGTDILVSQEVLDAAGKGFVVRRIGRVRPRGTEGYTEIFELAGSGWEAPESRVMAEEADRQKAIAWNGIIGLFYDRKFREMISAIDSFRKEYPEDRVALVYRTLALKFLRKDPGPDWQGLLSLH